MVSFAMGTFSPMPNLSVSGGMSFGLVKVRNILSHIESNTPKLLPWCDGLSLWWM